MQEEEQPQAEAPADLFGEDDDEEQQQQQLEDFDAPEEEAEEEAARPQSQTVGDRRAALQLLAKQKRGVGAVPSCTQAVARPAVACALFTPLCTALRGGSVTCS